MQFEGAGITLEHNVIAMLSECGDHPPMYEDPDFGAKSVSLYNDPETLPEYATSTKRSTDDIGTVHWYRPTQVAVDPDYFKCTAGCGVLREGTGLNDAWLLGVFAALALHPDNLIENLFVSPMHDFKTYGIYTCQFYKDCQWLEVVTDTRLPYSQQLDEVNEPGIKGSIRPGHWLYGSSVNKSEVFVPLLAKAYAKFHGNYEVLHNGSILEAFVDCTGGSVKKIDLSLDQTRRQIENGQLWHKIVKHVHYKSILTCQLKMASMQYNEVTGSGIVKNHLYVIQYVKELGPLKFVKLKNVWQKGLWKGDWSNEDNKWEDNLQVEAALRADPQCDFNRAKNDGTFWIIWDDFVEAFNEIYIVRNFPSTFNQYCVRGEWIGQAAAGPPAKLLERDTPTSPTNPIQRKWSIEPESEPAWFLNPQYRIVVNEKTSVVISLLQRDFRVFGGDNYAINFVLIRMKKRSLQASMVWEFDKESLIAEAHSYSPGLTVSGEKASIHPEREISKGNIVLEPDFSYVLVPYTNHPGVEMEFFLRVFSPKACIIDSLRPLHTLVVQGRWRVDEESITAGGPLCNQLTSGAENLSWCQNPQFILRAATELSKSIDIKVVLKRTGFKTTAKGRRDHQKDKGQLIGLTIVKPDVEEVHTTTKKKSIEKTNFLGEPVLSPMKPRRKLDNNADAIKSFEAQLPSRKLLVKADEYCCLSEYSGPQVGSIFLQKVPPEWLTRGLLVVPSMGEARVEGAFDIEIHSDDVLSMEELPNTMSRTITGEWNEKKGNAGGSHLCPDWKKNPKIYLTLKSVRPATVTIHLYRSEYEWRNKCKKDSVGTMMGFYLFQGTKLNRDASNILVDGRAWTETDFVPLHHVSSPAHLNLPPLFNDSYVIMPATWESNKSGRFLLSVSSDCEFSLTGEEDT